VAVPFDKTFQRALAALQGGQLDDAERSFKELLDAEPQHVAGLNLYAILLIQLERFEEAEDYLRRALRKNPKSDATLSNYGIVLAALKRPVEATERFTQALALNPSAVETWNSRGTVFNGLGQYQQAIADFDRAIALNSKYTDAFCNKGNSLAALKLWDQSLAAYDAAIALNQRLANAWLGRAKILLFVYKDYKTAADAYDRALSLKPDLAETWVGLGNIFYQSRQYDRALAAYEKAIELNPDLSDGWHGRANVLYETKRHDEAITAYDKLLGKSPALAWLGRGSVYSDLGLDDQALAAFEQAIALSPDLANAWSARGSILARATRHEEAFACYEKAVELSPDYAEGYFNKGLLKLLVGDLEAGWPLYEWRWKIRNLELSARHFAKKQWLGHENISAKTVLVHSEQGFGDTIQFYRYISKLTGLGCKIIFETQAPLVSLINANSNIYQVISQGETLPNFDVHCPLLSLPLAFNTTLETIPASVPYLFPSPERLELWRTKFDRKATVRIGLVWSGKLLPDFRRSIPLELLLRIINEKAEWHSLQKDVLESDQSSLHSTPTIRNHASSLIDFSDTAALITEMDLVISIDTAVAHLAGALGKPVWVLLPFHPDFRWLQEREDSPWYPTARLFRQPLPGDWAAVVERVRQELTSFIQAGEA
jgi:tetratricopeptide (TPR) repeat protein